MQSLIRSKSAGVTGRRGTAGAGPGRDLLYLSEVLQLLLALNTFGLQVQQPPEFLSVMLRQWHVISSRPRQSISTPGHGLTCVHRLHV